MSVFVNYRQNTRVGGTAIPGVHAQAVEALVDRLRLHFGRERVFLDTGMRTASRYPDELRTHLKQADLVVSVVHREWLAELDSRRSASTKDWVRHELATAFAEGIPVLPVLLDGADIPAADTLPEDIRELAHCQALRVRFGYWPHDTARLIQDVEKHVAAEELPPVDAEPVRQPISYPLFAAAAVLGLALGAAAVWLCVDAGTRAAWAVALSIVGALALGFVASLLGIMHLVRKGVDQLDSAWARRPDDERLNVVIGLTIAGLALLVAMTGDFLTPEARMFVIGVVTIFVIVSGTGWLRRRDKAGQWPRDFVSASPQAVRAELAVISRRLDAGGLLLSRKDRDRIGRALAQTGAAVGRLREGRQRGALWGIRRMPRWIPLPYSAFASAVIGVHGTAVVAMAAEDWPPWPVHGWLAAGLVGTGLCVLATIRLHHSLVRWRNTAVMGAVDATLDELAARLAAASIPVRQREHEINS